MLDALEVSVPKVTLGSRRLASLGKASLAMGASGGISLLVSLALAPLTLGYLGAERFGIWMAAVALTAVLEPLDLGIRNALMTRLATADARGRNRESSELILAAFRVLAALSAGLILVVIVAAFVLPFDQLFGVSSESGRAVITPVVLVVGCGLALNLPLGLVDTIFLGYREGERTGTMLSLGHLLSLGSVVALSSLRADLPWLAAGLISGPIVARGIQARRLWAEGRLTISGTPTPVATRSSLFSSARFFFALQVAVAVGFAADQLVISSMLGAEAVATYAVPARAFAVVSTAVAVLVRPLWPAMTEAKATGDWRWAVRTFRRLLVAVGGFAVVASALLAALGPDVYARMGRGEVAPTWSLIIANALWAVLLAVGTAVGTVLNGLDIRKPLLVTAIAMAIANIAVSIALVGPLGVAGPVWGSVISYTVCVVLPLSIIVPRVLRERLDAAS